MKVLLINPPNTNEITSCNPEIIKEQRGYDPPLGLLYLAGYLSKYSDFDVKILDAQVERLSYDKIKQRLAEIKPDVVGITAMTFTLIDVIEAIKAIKEVSDKTKIVLGGPHVHIYPEETINLKNVDFAVLGEGEKIFLDLINNIDDIEKLKTIKGLVFKVNDEIINTGWPEFIHDLDNLPFPARELTPVDKYFSLLAKQNPITTMFTSRGCPYRCTFCDRPAMGKRFRSRSAKNVVDEMQKCLELGIKEIFVYDDTFTVDRQRVIEICDEILKRKLKFSWDVRARVNTIDQEVLKKLKKAGCVRIHYGVEAGTEKILKVLNKGITLDQALKVFKMTKKMGISTLAYFMVGSPTETKEDVLKTIKFAKKLDPDFVQITMLTPFPATQIYTKGLEEGIFKNDYWREFAKNPTRDFKTKYWEKDIPFDELQDLVVYAYKQFYIRPKYILERILKIRSWTELKRKAKAGLNVLFMRSV